MQIDMHFYGVFAMARAAGIEPETAKIIAHASQFVDDAIYDEAVVLPGERAILPTMTSHRPLDYGNAIPGDQWKVWVPFHFLPGNEPESGTFVEKMICREDSDPARVMLKNALDARNKDYWPHLVGIVAHVYADTFSHFGFIGFAHPWNRVKGDSIEASDMHSSSILQYIQAKFEDFKTRFASDFAEIIPAGHGAVGTYPDRPYLKWRFEYETGNPAYRRGRHDPGDTDRDNVVHFLEGCKGLYDFFFDFLQATPDIQDSTGPRAWDEISGDVETILRKEGPKDERIMAWKEAISSGLFCRVTPVDREIEYDGGLWQPGKLEKEPDILRFFRAAWRHRHYVLHELLPEIGILV
ncbi:MAG: hypothetical protein JRJ13_06900 [Deltaproteobacteria bacterium]|nr:hypothetical protein [Deltaproteobacteria bacterium]MBW1976011.1 hypothetical protein [Deltaproteobacteria bacterium]